MILMKNLLKVAILNSVKTIEDFNKLTKFYQNFGYKIIHLIILLKNQKKK